MNHYIGWYPFEEGQTIGAQGTEHGVIIHDEEHSLGARMTLEQDAFHAPCAITCGIYGWMVHTRFFADEETAFAAYEQMRTAIEDILRMIPSEDDPTAEAQFNAVSEAVAEFTQRFP
jgi:hypothetical protein